MQPSYVLYWFEDPKGREWAYLFVELPDPIILWPLITTRDDGKQSILALTADDELLLSLPDFEWELMCLVSGLPENTRNFLLSSGGGQFKQMGCESGCACADTFPELINKIGVKEHYAILQYLGTTKRLYRATEPALR